MVLVWQLENDAARPSFNEPVSDRNTDVREYPQSKSYTEREGSDGKCHTSNIGSNTVAIVEARFAQRKRIRSWINRA